MSDLMELVNECEKAADHPTGKQPIELIDELRNLGFTQASHKLLKESWRKIQLFRIGLEKYPVITDAKIFAFLDKKVEAYNKEHKRKPQKLARNQTSLDYINASLNEMRNRAMRQALGTDWSTQYTIDQTTTATGASLGIGLVGVVGRDHIPNLMRETVDYRNADGIGKFAWQETTLADYAGIPPKHVLQMLRNVKDKQIFDSFTIAEVNSLKDPLLLGRLHNHADRWFLSQWGDDVSLDDVI